MPPEVPVVVGKIAQQVCVERGGPLLAGGTRSEITAPPATAAQDDGAPEHETGSRGRALGGAPHGRSRLVRASRPGCSTASRPLQTAGETERRHREKRMVLFDAALPSSCSARGWTRGPLVRSGPSRTDRFAGAGSPAGWGVFLVRGRSSTNPIRVTRCRRQKRRFFF